MPQIGEDKKPTGGKASRPSKEPAHFSKEYEEEPVVSAYTEEGQQRIKDYEASQKKKARTVTIISVALLAALIIGLLIYFYFSSRSS